MALTPRATIRGGSSRRRRSSSSNISSSSRITLTLIFFLSWAAGLLLVAEAGDTTDLTVRTSVCTAPFVGQRTEALVEVANAHVETANLLDARTAAVATVEAATRRLSTALKGAPHYRFGYLTLGEALSYLGRPPSEPLRAYERAASLSREAGDAGSEALAEYNAALLLTAEDSTAAERRMNVAWGLLRVHAPKVPALVHIAAGAAVTLAQLRSHRMDLGAAAAVLTQANDLFPDMPQVLMELANVAFVSASAGGAGVSIAGVAVSPSALLRRALEVATARGDAEAATLAQRNLAIVTGAGSSDGGSGTSSNDDGNAMLEPLRKVLRMANTSISSASVNVDDGTMSGALQQQQQLSTALSALIMDLTLLSRLGESRGGVRWGELTDVEGGVIAVMSLCAVLMHSKETLLAPEQRAPASAVAVLRTCQRSAGSWLPFVQAYFGSAMAPWDNALNSAVTALRGTRFGVPKRAHSGVVVVHTGAAPGTAGSGSNNSSSSVTRQCVTDLRPLSVAIAGYDMRSHATGFLLEGEARHVSHARVRLSVYQYGPVDPGTPMVVPPSEACVLIPPDDAPEAAHLGGQAATGAAGAETDGGCTMSGVAALALVEAVAPNGDDASVPMAPQGRPRSACGANLTPESTGEQRSSPGPATTAAEEDLSAAGGAHEETSHVASVPGRGGKGSGDGDGDPDADGIMRVTGGSSMEQRGSWRREAQPSRTQPQPSSFPPASADQHESLPAVTGPWSWERELWLTGLGIGGTQSERYVRESAAFYAVYSTAATAAIAAHMRGSIQCGPRSRSTHCPAAPVDILVDPMANTFGHREAVIAAKPARLVASHMVAATSGLRAVDYFIGDPTKCPPESSIGEVLIGDPVSRLLRGLGVTYPSRRIVGLAPAASPPLSTAAKRVADGTQPSGAPVPVPPPRAVSSTVWEALIPPRLSFPLTAGAGGVLGDAVHTAAAAPVAPTQQTPPFIVLPTIRFPAFSERLVLLPRSYSMNYYTCALPLIGREVPHELHHPIAAAAAAAGGGGAAAGTGAAPPTSRRPSRAALTRAIALVNVSIARGRVVQDLLAAATAAASTPQQQQEQIVSMAPRPCVRAPSAWWAQGPSSQQPQLPAPPPSPRRLVCMVVAIIEKMDPQLFTAWTDVLAAVPTADLWLLGAGKKTGATGPNAATAAEPSVGGGNSSDADSGVSPPFQRLMREAAARGIPRARIRLLPRVSRDEYITRLGGEADLVLDTRVYSGHTTTLDALWMGVPVVTIEGSTVASRVSSSHLQAGGRGLSSVLVTHTLKEFTSTAVGLLQRPTALAALRRRVLFAAARCAHLNWAMTARNLERGYRAMFESSSIVDLVQHHSSSGTTTTTTTTTVGGERGGAFPAADVTAFQRLMHILVDPDLRLVAPCGGVGQSLAQGGESQSVAPGEDQPPEGAAAGLGGAAAAAAAARYAAATDVRMQHDAAAGLMLRHLGFTEASDRCAARLAGGAL